jgi:hypothetical protein
MAQGRFLSTTIAIDKELARLSAEAEMMYLKCIPHLDRDGMITGDPIQLLTVISPLRFSQMAPSIGAIVDAWVDVGLVIRFPTQAGLALFFKGFLKNQTLRYDRERPSLYPPPPGYIHTANGLRPATDVPWVDSSSEENPGSYPKTPAESPVLPEFYPLGENDARTAAEGSSNGTPGYYPKNPAESPFLPESAAQAESEAESAAPKQQDTGKQQAGPAAAAGHFSECRRLLVDFGVSEPSLTRILAKRHPPDHVRGWLVEAIQASQRRRKPIDDPIAFAVARLLSGDPPPRLVDAAEYATGLDACDAGDDDEDSFEALKRRYVPDGWENVVRH